MGCQQLWETSFSSDNDGRMGASLLSGLRQQISFDTMRRTQMRTTSACRVTDSLLALFPRCRLFPSSGAGSRNGTLLNPQRTKKHIPRIPLGAAALHTGNTSLLYLGELTIKIIFITSRQISKHSRVLGHNLDVRVKRTTRQEAAEPFPRGGINKRCSPAIKMKSTSSLGSK